MCDQARQAGYQEHGVAELVGEPEVGADGRDGTVHVDRQRAVEPILPRLDRPLGGAKQPHVLAVEFELERHLKQTRGPRIARVEAVPEPGRHLVIAQTVVDERVGRLLQRASGADERQTGVQKPHARLDVATMMRPERQNAGRDTVFERGAGGRDVARRQRRGRRDAVIDRRHEHGVEHAADRRRRQLAHEQQIHRVGEREASHHLVERVPTDEDLVRRDRRERGLPTLCWCARLGMALVPGSCAWLGHM